MIRWWNETMAAFGDAIPIPLMVFLSFIVTALFAVGWYYWPSWLPPYGRHRRSGAGRSSRSGDRRARFKLGRLRWRLRWRRRRRTPEDPVPSEDLGPDDLPDLPAALLTLSADQLAEAGRFAEAVRERLRAILRDLIERGLIPPSPGWTVTELGRQAALTVPPLGQPLNAAVDVFSSIWYGLRPATADDNSAMRTHAAAVGQILADASNPMPKHAERGAS